MKNKLMQGLLCCVVLPCSVEAMGPHVNVSDIRYAGSGCPKGTVSVSMTPSKRAVNTVFDHYFTSFSGKPNQQIKRCKPSMNLVIPKNQRVRLRQVRFRGFYDLPLNSFTKIVRNYRFGSAKKQMTNAWKGKAFKVIDRNESFASEWSACGKSVRLEIDSMMELKSRAGATSQVGVDSFDHLMKRDYRGARGWKFMLEYRSC